MNVLVIAAHPDDDVIGMGGTIAQHVAAGDLVQTVFLTSGELGCPGEDPIETAARREAEAIAACDLLGELRPIFLRYPDAHLDESNGVSLHLAGQISANGYEVIYVTHPGDAHRDHRAAAEFAQRAVRRLPTAGVRLLGYEVWTPIAKPSELHELSLEHLGAKVQAILAHESQVAITDYAAASVALNKFRGIMHGPNKRPAEAFVLLEGPMRITVALFTYAPEVDHPRADYAIATLRAALQNLNAGPDIVLRWHIADDGSDPRHIERLVALCQMYGVTPTITNAQRGGYGRSYNLMTQAVHGSTDLVLPLEDDWLLTRPLDLAPLAEALMDRSGGSRPFGCIRLGYLGFTQELRGEVIHAGRQTFLVLDPDSQEPHIFTGHPRLESVEFERNLGDWPEGLAAGATEWALHDRPAARRGIAWPLDLGISADPDNGALFAHIGSVGVGQVVPSK